MMGASNLAILVSWMPFFSISAIGQILARNIKVFNENCGNMTPAAKGRFLMKYHMVIS